MGVLHNVCLCFNIVMSYYYIVMCQIVFKSHDVVCTSIIRNIAFIMKTQFSDSQTQYHCCIMPINNQISLKIHLLMAKHQSKFLEITINCL